MPYTLIDRWTLIYLPLLTSSDFPRQHILYTTATFLIGMRRIWTGRRNQSTTICVFSVSYINSLLLHSEKSAKKRQTNTKSPLFAPNSLHTYKFYFPFSSCFHFLTLFFIMIIICIKLIIIVIIIGQRHSYGHAQKALLSKQ